MWSTLPSTTCKLTSCGHSSDARPRRHRRVVETVAADAVGKTRDSLIVELRGSLFRPEDVRFDTGRSEGGDFIRVVHVPSGIERSAMRRESSHEELLDAVLEELFARETGV
jgi:hypothetical protein